MCYSAALTSKNVDLKEKYKKKIPADLMEEPLFHVHGFSFPYWRVLTRHEDIQLMRWGLVPSWYQGPNHNEMAGMTLNARAESIHEKASFRHLIGSQHCIVPMNGFYEYQTNGKEKKPFFVFPSEGELFSMAGIYDSYLDKSTGEILTSFSVITCEANELMADIHNSKKRMPVLLDETGQDLWLNEPTKTDRLLVPSPNEWLSAHPVDAKILKGADHNSPRAQQKFDPPKYEQGSLF